MEEPRHVRNSLPISHSKELTVLSKEMLHMQLPFHNEFFFPWFYCHFINIYYYLDTYFNYIDSDSFTEIFDAIVLDFSQVVEFNTPETVRNGIDRGYYFFAWINNYYNPKSEFYLRVNDIHPVLVYGYDMTNEIYQFAAFDIRQGLLLDEIPVQDLHTALAHTGELY